MRGLTFIYLILIGITSQACSANNQILLSQNGQEASRQEAHRSFNQNANTPDTMAETRVDNDLSIKTTKGLIVLSDEYVKNDFIRLYNNDGSLWYEFTFYYEDMDGAFEYENSNFRPFAFHPDYFVLALRCVGEDDDRYEVVVNEESGLKKFVKKKDSTIRFQTWEEHIMKAYAVGFAREQNPLRETPNGSSKNLNLVTEPTFHPVEIKGEWLKVRWSESEKSERHINTGWVKWRDKDRLLIKLFYFS